MPAADLSNPPGGTETDVLRAAKSRLRAEIRAARATPEPSSVSRARTALALELCAGHRTVALYASAADEPDTWALIDALHAAGRTVLLPLLGRSSDGSVRRSPEWAEYGGRTELRPGYAGILEPARPGLGARALAGASLVWCAGLAATARGDRLGTGGGWYDRALPLAAPDALIAVLLRDSEVLPALPVEPFDWPVGAIVTGTRLLLVEPD